MSGGPDLYSHGKQPQAPQLYSCQIQPKTHLTEEISMRVLVFLVLGAVHPLLLAAQASEAGSALESQADAQEEVNQKAKPKAPSRSYRTMDPPDEPDPFRLSRQGRPWQQAVRARLQQRRVGHRTAAAPHRTGVTAVRTRARPGVVSPAVGRVRRP